MVRPPASIIPACCGGGRGLDSELPTPLSAEEEAVHAEIDALCASNCSSPARGSPAVLRSTPLPVHDVQPSPPSPPSAPFAMLAFSIQTHGWITSEPEASRQRRLQQGDQSERLKNQLSTGQFGKLTHNQPWELEFARVVQLGWCATSIDLSLIHI